MTYRDVALAHRLNTVAIAASPAVVTLIVFFSFLR